MPVIIEIPANLMAAEHRHAFKAQSPSWDHAIVSGEVDLVNSAPLSIEGENDDDLTEYEIHSKSARGGAMSKSACPSSPSTATSTPTPMKMTSSSGSFVI